MKHVSGLPDLVLIWKRPEPRGFNVPLNPGGMVRVVVLGEMRSGEVMARGWASGRWRSHCWAARASGSVALLVGLAW